MMWGFKIALFVLFVSYSSELLAADSVNCILSKYGPPDTEDSTAYDKPRPPMVTRWLDYKSERVRVMLLADAQIDSPPPYKDWKVIGFIDPIASAKLSQEAADKRLAKRKKNDKYCEEIIQ